MNDPIPDVFAPAKLGPITLRNRIVKAATYEGLSKNSLVTDRLIDFHVRHAAGGVGMTTVAYCAVAPDGRTDRKQILWTDEALPGLRELTEAVHAEGAAVAAQIGHAGPVANPKGNGAPALAPGRICSVRRHSRRRARRFHRHAPHAPNRGPARSRLKLRKMTSGRYGERKDASHPAVWPGSPSPSGR